MANWMKRGRRLFSRYIHVPQSHDHLIGPCRPILRRRCRDKGGIWLMPHQICSLAIAMLSIL